MKWGLMSVLQEEEDARVKPAQSMHNGSVEVA